MPFQYKKRRDMRKCQGRARWVAPLWTPLEPLFLHAILLLVDFAFIKWECLQRRQGKGKEGEIIQVLSVIERNSDDCGEYFDSSLKTERNGITTLYF